MFFLDRIRVIPDSVIIQAGVSLIIGSRDILRSGANFTVPLEEDADIRINPDFSFPAALPLKDIV